MGCFKKRNHNYLFSTKQINLAIRCSPTFYCNQKHAITDQILKLEIKKKEKEK